MRLLTKIHRSPGRLNFGALRKMDREGLADPFSSWIGVRGMSGCQTLSYVLPARGSEAFHRGPWAGSQGSLCGPITRMTPSSKWYFLLLVDDYSRYMWVTLLATKDTATVVIQHIQATVE
jgi:hypothetical protein